MSTICACSRASKLPLTAASRSSLAITRSFSSTTPTSAPRREKIPPQSPDFITVPRPKQNEASEIKPTRIPGTLPPPRQVVSDSPKDHKLRPGFVERTAPRPKNEASRREVPADSPADIRRRMADARRRNFADGFEGLLARKQAYDAVRTVRNARAASESRRIREAPEREDDVLTRPTVLQSTLTHTAVLPDPKRFERAEASKRQTAQILHDRAEERRNALMTLYATAKDFIVDEKHLAREVDRLFSDDYFKKQARSHATDAANAWDVWGTPPTLTQINVGANLGLLHEWDTSDAERSARRQKNIAEELTGGKME